MANRRWKVTDFIFLGSKITADRNCSHEIKRLLHLERKAMTNLKQRHHFADKGPYHQSYGFSSDHVRMWELEHVEGWGPKNWCFWIVVLQKSWESLGLQGDQTSQSQRKSILNIHWQDWYWSWISSTLTTWCKEQTHCILMLGETEGKTEKGW